MSEVKFKRIAVLGAGMMGSGLAQIFATKSYSTIVYDTQRSQFQKSLNTITTNLKLMADHGIGEECAIDSILSRIMFVNRLEEVADADFVFECVPENMDLKQNIMKQLDHLCKPSTILATNTSVMSITEIAKKAFNRGRIVGTHFWNPPFLIPLVEVVKAEDTEDQVMDLTLQFLKKVGKRPVRVNKDVPGFVANRLQHALWREAVSIVENGIADPATVDECIKNSFGMRLPVLGPFENIDMAGTVLTLSIHDYIFKYLENTTEASALLKEKVANGDLGFKSGKGFQEWSPESIEKSNKKLLEYLLKVTKESEKTK
ncbi:3-hydroxyacyl-CoA dehydrogenase family protein [Desulfosporosinus fructosivorans]